MKHRILPLANLMLGLSLLQTAAPTSGHQHNSRKSKTKSEVTKVQITKPATPTSTPPSLAGSYALNDPGAAERVRAAIEAAVKDLSIFSKGSVHKALTETNLPPPRALTISFTDTEVSITTDIAGEVRTSTDGTPKDWSMGKEAFKVSTIWDQCNLIRTYKGRAKRVNVYSLSDGGRTLTMQVTITRKATVGGFSMGYKLVYRRV